jgi:hypothetical protein
VVEAEGEVVEDMEVVLGVEEEDLAAEVMLEVLEEEVDLEDMQVDLVVLVEVLQGDLEVLAEDMQELDAEGVLQEPMIDREVVVGTVADDHLIEEVFIHTAGMVVGIIITMEEATTILTLTVTILLLLLQLQTRVFVKIPNF